MIWSDPPTCSLYHRGRSPLLVQKNSTHRAPNIHLCLHQAPGKLCRIVIHYSQRNTCISHSPAKISRGKSSTTLWRSFEGSVCLWNPFAQQSSLNRLSTKKMTRLSRGGNMCTTPCCRAVSKHRLSHGLLSLTQFSCMSRRLNHCTEGQSSVYSTPTRALESTQAL